MVTPGTSGRGWHRVQTVLLLLLLALGRFLTNERLDLPLFSELWFYDLCSQLRSDDVEFPPGLDVKLVTYDDQTFAKEEEGNEARLPVHTEVLKAVLACGPRVVGCDLLIGGLKDAPGSEPFLTALEDPRVVVGTQLKTEEAPTVPTGATTRKKIKEHNLQQGFANLSTDARMSRKWNRRDVIRAVSLAGTLEDRVLHSFDLEIARRALGLRAQDVRVTPRMLHLGDRRIQLVDRALLIPYPIRPGVISYDTIRKPGGLPPHLVKGIKDKVVLIGSTARSESDHKRTPVGVLPGVRIHLGALTALLGDRAITPAGDPLGLLLMAGVWGLVLFIHHRRGGRAALAWGLTVFFVLGAGQVLLLLKGLWVRGFYACLAGPVTAAFCLWTETRKEPVYLSQIHLSRGTLAGSGAGSLAGMPSLSPADLTFNIAAQAVDPRYQELELLGRGGMGIVLSGKDTLTGQRVAIKVLAPLLTDRSDLVKRFWREVSTLKDLDHDGIVRILDMGPETALPYYVMEYVSGRQLREYSMDEGPLDLPRIEPIFRQLFETLAYIHDRKVIHRDVKPENIMVTNTGRVKILDFGLAHLSEASTLTQVGQIMGTLRYMSPEQREGQDLTPTSDIFSAALLLYEELSGHYPWPLAGQLLNFMEPYRSLKHWGREVSPGLEELLALALKLDPAERIPTCHEVLARWKAAFGPIAEPVPGPGLTPSIP